VFVFCFDKRRSSSLSSGFCLSGKWETRNFQSLIFPICVAPGASPHRQAARPRRCAQGAVLLFVCAPAGPSSRRFCAAFLRLCLCHTQQSILGCRSLDGAPWRRCPSASRSPRPRRRPSEPQGASRVGSWAAFVFRLRSSGNRGGRARCLVCHLAERFLFPICVGAWCCCARERPCPAPVASLCFC
jgi:hypothetical protein